MNDTEALDAIGALLGDAEDWSSPADYLERLADLVCESGRPHPGAARGVAIDYAAELKAERLYRAMGPSQQNVVDSIADLNGGDVSDGGDEYARACREVIANGLGLGLDSYDDSSIIVALVRHAHREGELA
jgi:hypothetical protein